MLQPVPEDPEDVVRVTKQVAVAAKPGTKIDAAINLVVFMDFWGLTQVRQILFFCKTFE